MKKTIEWNWKHHCEHCVHLPLNSLNEKKYKNCEILNLTYRISRFNPILSDSAHNKLWVINRMPEVGCEIAYGFLGVWKNKIGIVGTRGFAYTKGLPDCAYFKNYKYCKKICKMDWDNLKNGRNIVFNDFLTQTNFLEKKT